jgi:hypothetical protein
MSLRIVFATYALNGPGGSESYCLTVAHELQRLGHEVTLVAEELGAVAELAQRRGLRVARGPSELPSECDVALVQDAIVTGAVLDRFPRIRVVHVAHSDLFDHQLPTMVRGVVDAVIVLSDRVAERVRALALDAPVVRLRQPIDTRRFASTTPLPQQPRRALLLGNYLDGKRRDALVETWQGAGLECVQVGIQAHAAVDVMPAIMGADIVVAKGRAALEAMSCARAVYVYDQFGGDGWVTAENYAALEADGFAGHATPAPRGPEDLAADLAGYQPSMGPVNSELVRNQHPARQHAAQLVEVLRGPHAGEGRELAGLDEVSRLARLFMEAEGRAMSLWHDFAALQAREIDARAEIEHLRARANEVEAREARMQRLLATRRARAGLALGRILDRLRKQKCTPS